MGKSPLSVRVLVLSPAGNRSNDGCATYLPGWHKDRIPVAGNLRNRFETFSLRAGRQSSEVVAVFISWI